VMEQEAPKALPRDGDQLRLDLFAGEPWDGRSPRVLTRGHLGIIFKARAAKSTGATDFCEQLELWPKPAEERPFIYEGAPLLQPLRG